MNNSAMYTREKPLAVTFAGETRNFVLVSLSAAGQEQAVAAAQAVHSETLAKLLTVEASIKNVCLLQDIDLLREAVLVSEQEDLQQKAALTLADADDEPEYQARLADKTEQVKEGRRSELLHLSKEQLGDMLTGREISRQSQAAWQWATLEATLVEALHGEDGQRLFNSLAAMKQSLPAEVLEKLCEALLEFLTGRGTAQSFLKPHTSRK